MLQNSQQVMPYFIQCLSKRPGGLPELRITRIDFPCPVFKPSERVEETGNRLANYAESYRFPFKFKAIAQKFRYLLDETVMAGSVRNKVLNFIKKLKPDMFIQGVINESLTMPPFLSQGDECHSCEGGERFKNQKHINNGGYLKLAKYGVKSCYHRDFGIDEDDDWLLQLARQERTHYICIIDLSSWKPLDNKDMLFRGDYGLLLHLMHLDASNDIILFVI
ncbi:hypothetical protein R6Q59_008930 [Mikania micrantha]